MNSVFHFDPSKSLGCNSPDLINQTPVEFIPVFEVSLNNTNREAVMDMQEANRLIFR